ncbi:hypothetical protein POM88_022154 [Heracleum sosnowskyi]|uniref:Uncharacterized protein n=1 Tax=Heracleum sosnowskyi TaxID=360622 RepID=A0AAD8IG95_9APIA|nr:hypothetical protein POM88_022154 [Heracleum sosnowskyi]
MAPIVKLMSAGGFIYEKNNSIPFVVKENPNRLFFKMMDFMKNCKLSYAMFHSTPLYNEIIEEIWTSCEYSGTNCTLQFTLQGNEYIVNSDVLQACLHIPDNNCDVLPTNTEITTMLNSINYSLPTDNLGRIIRRGLVREYSYLADAFIKVFSGKISNFDALTNSMLILLTMLLNDRYHNFSTQLMYEIGAKLGDKANRKKNIYYARFLMMLANHVSPAPLVISNPNARFECFVQEKRVLTDILRLNHNGDVPVVYLPIIEVTTTIPVSVANTSTVLPSNVAMESVAVTQQAPALATKPKSKKSSKPTSGASQKAPVVKTTTQPKGSESGVVRGEGRGEHQRNPKDKEGQVSVYQPSPIVSSQQGTMSNMDLNTSLIASSQKDVIIETSSPPRAQSKRVRDTSSPQSTFSQYQRRVKQKSKGTQGAHTLEATLPVSQIQFDVTPIITLGLQSHSLNINLELSPSNSPTQSLDVDMIHTSIPDSPTLILEKPHSEAGGHHLLSDLLGHQPIFPEVARGSVDQSLKSITTDSTVISHSQSAFLTSSTKQSISLTSVSPSTVSIPLTVQTTIPLIVHSAPLIENQVVPTTSADDLVVVETLLGLRGSETERLACSQAKGENVSERLAISSSQAKGEIESSTLEGEGEGVRGVSHGEPMMQEQSGEREGTTGVIRMEAVIASELMEVSEGERELTFQEVYQQTLDSISLDPETFTHPVSAYQVLAQQGNVEAERSLQLIHTTASMQRAKDALTNLPPGAEASGEFDFSDNEDSFGDILQVATTAQTGTSVVPPTPNWLSQDMHGRCNLDAAITRQYNEAYLAHESAGARDKKFYKAIMDSLEIQRLQMLQTRIEATEIKDSISNFRAATDRRLDEKLPLHTVSRMSRFFTKEPEVSSSLKTLSSRVDKVEATLSHMQKEQEKQTQLLTQLLAAQGLPIISLDANKKGEKSKELDIQITKVMVPAISLPEEPLAMGEFAKKKKDSIDLIQEASLRMKLAEQIKDHWSNIEAKVKKLADTKKVSSVQATSIPPSTNAMVTVQMEPQFRSSYVMEPLQHGVLQNSRNEKGQVSCLRNVDARGISPVSPIKPKGKNIERIAYPPPKPDEFKVLGKLIKESKESNHPSIRNKRVLIYRDSKEIYIWVGHPNFAKAKAEESERAAMQALAVAQSLEDEEAVQEEKAKDKAKEAGKKKRTSQPKARAKRNLNFDEDDSQETAQDSSTTSAHQIPVDLPIEGKLACDPAHPVNFHDHPIMPKEEPFEFDEAYFPKFLLEKDQPMKTKKRSVKAKPVLVRKPQSQKPPANPEDCMYIADIREESSLHLDLDNLVEVRGIAASQKLPERLVFIFKGGSEQVWPLYRILGEDYQTLLSVFRCLKKDFGFTKTAKSEVVSKICQIKASWNKPEALPRILRVPSTGKKIHLQPYWMMEFKDKDNCRRFFRMEDQLEKASNQTLKLMQSKLGDQDEEEKIFYRRLQVQIEENNSKKGKKTMPQRNHR